MKHFANTLIMILCIMGITIEAVLLSMAFLWTFYYSTIKNCYHAFVQNEADYDDDKFNNFLIGLLEYKFKITKKENYEEEVY